MLVIHIDLSSIGENNKKEIIENIKEGIHAKDDNKPQGYLKIIYGNADGDEISESGYQNHINGIALQEGETQISKIKHQIKDLFISKAISEYIVVQDKAVTNKLMILMRSHGESEGMHHCRHCGMEFEDEIQLGSHLRIHFLI